MKPITDFHLKGSGRRHCYCGACKSRYNQEYAKRPEVSLRRATNRKAYNNRPAIIEKRNAYNKSWHFHKKYGIEPKEAERIREQQGGLCAICNEMPNGRGLMVDHCHTSGKIRGLLCHYCNCGLGHFRDDVVRLRAAADYIEK